MKDLFSHRAQQYASFRPTYPKELYDFILPLTSGRSLAWDCATGNGQVARDLAPRFQKVFATDISAKQIQHAHHVPNIEYAISPAEKTSFPESYFDLITVGQAIHWIDRPSFYREVVRVAKPGAILAVWGYALLKITPVIDELISDYYVNVVGPYWDKERKLVDEQYKTISFPFEEVSNPGFRISFEWSLDELEGYFGTWSAVQKYIQVNGVNPVEPLIKKIKPFWGTEKKTVNFPVFLRCGIVNK